MHISRTKASEKLEHLYLHYSLTKKFPFTTRWFRSLEVIKRQKTLRDRNAFPSFRALRLRILCSLAATLTLRQAHTYWHHSLPRALCCHNSREVGFSLFLVLILGVAYEIPVCNQTVIVALQLVQLKTGGGEPSEQHFPAYASNCSLLFPSSWISRSTALYILGWALPTFASTCMGKLYLLGLKQ